MKPRMLYYQAKNVIGGLLSRKPELSVVYECPGCFHTHYVAVEGQNNMGVTWEFNGDLYRPTLTPSVNEWHDAEPDVGIPAHRCHHFVRDGMIEFLGDCLHPAAGQTMPLNPVSNKFIHHKRADGSPYFLMERPK